MKFSLTPRAFAMPALVGVLALCSVARAAPEQAQSSEKFVDSAGVNVKLGYTDTPYADVARVRDVLLAANIHHVREGLEHPDRLEVLGAAGIKLTGLVAPSREGMNAAQQKAEMLARLHAVQKFLVAVEGPNEPDGGYIRELKPFPQAVIDYQKLLYQTVKADPELKKFPVIVPSIAGPPNSAQVPNQPGDFANTHSYHGARMPETTENNLDLPNFYLGNAAIQAPGKPVVCTETGNTTTQYDDPSLWMPRVSEWTQGKYTLRTLCHYYSMGIVRTFFHELIDEHPVPGQAEANFGLLRNDWSPKPAYRGLKNLLNLLADPAPPEDAWKPSTLDWELSGETANVRHLLFQKRNGNFYLVLWQAVKSYDPDLKLDLGVADANVVLKLQAPISAGLVYSPLHFERAGGAIANRNGEIKVGVPDYPIVVELIPRGPDLIVADLFTDAPPVAGKPIALKARLKNIGIGMTPPDIVQAVTFFDLSGAAPQVITFGLTNQRFLAPGEEVVVTGGMWTPAKTGAISIEAKADDVDRIYETDEANNRLVKKLNVAAQ